MTSLVVKEEMEVEMVPPSWRRNASPRYTQAAKKGAVPPSAGLLVSTKSSDAIPTSGPFAVGVISVASKYHLPSGKAKLPRACVLSTVVTSTRLPLLRVRLELSTGLIVAKLLV